MAEKTGASSRPLIRGIGAGRDKLTFLKEGAAHGARHEWLDRRQLVWRWFSLLARQPEIDEGITVFNDPFSLTINDPDHSEDEQRYVDIEASDKGRVLVVSYT